MKGFLLLSIITILSYKSQAQQNLLAKNKVVMSHPIIYTTATNGRQWTQDESNRYRRMRSTGKVLTFSGIGLMAAGGILIATADKSGSFSSWDGQAIAGSVGLIAGALATTGGIVLWTKGNKKLNQGTTSLQVHPGGAAGLVYTF